MNRIRDARKSEVNRGSRASVFTVPRRFDLATIAIVTAAYALLFGLMRAMRFPAPEFALVSALVTCVGLGQALLFRGARPRLASVLVGVSLCIGACAYWALRGEWEPSYLIDEMLVRPAIAGIGFGYLAGVIVGSVFYTANLLRGFFGSTTDGPP